MSIFRKKNTPLDQKGTYQSKKAPKGGMLRYKENDETTTR